MGDTTRQKMLKAKALIKRHEFGKARAILKTVDHPIADKWLAKLDQIAPEKTRHEWVYWLILVAAVVFTVILVINSRTATETVPANVATATYTPQPTQAPLPTQPPPPPTPIPAPQYTCNCSKTCSQMSCREAYFQLNQCGCSRRDSDGDGIPCESQCG